MVWFVLALLTAVCWGLGYALTEKILHSGVSTSFLLAGLSIAGVPVFVAMGVMSGTFKTSIDALKEGSNGLSLILVAIIAVFIIGNITIMQAVQLKNATHVNLIEITYPLFTVLFTYLLFKNVHLDMTAALGALLIFAGTELILYKGA
jgi:drug/metabolite transporter (DMT)-like permease